MKLTKAQRERREDAIDSAIALRRLGEIRRNPKRLVTGAAAKKALAELIGKPKRRAQPQGKAVSRVEVEALAKYIFRESGDWLPVVNFAILPHEVREGYRTHARAALRWFANRKVKHA